MPVTELSFPAITVCRQGLDMAAVQRAMELDYEDWVARQGAVRRKRSLGSGESMDTYLQEMWVVLLFRFRLKTSPHSYAGSPLTPPSATP